MSVLDVVGMLLVLTFNFLFFVRKDYRPWYLACGLVVITFSIWLYNPSATGAIWFNLISLACILYGIYNPPIPPKPKESRFKPPF